MSLGETRRSLRLGVATVTSVAVALAAPAFAFAAGPAGATAIALNSTVQVSWQPAVGATAYTVYRGLSQTTITTAVTPPGGVAAPATSFSDTTTVNGTTYYYAVRAVVGGVESANSLVVQSTPVARSCSTGNPIVLENCYPGAASWNVRSAAQMPTGIEGFATAQSINKGGSLDLKVNSAASTTFNVEIYRTGSYNGVHARLFSIVKGVPGTAQPACASDGNTGIVDCANWSVSTTISTTTSWPTGIYLLRIVRADNGNDNQIMLVVRDDSRHPDVVYGTGFTTFEAYNNYGGKSLYDFNSNGSNTVAGTPRAVKVSMDRPFEQPRSGLRDWYTNTELATISWLEQAGYDMGYVSDGDLESQPGLLLGSKAYISPAHDEYVSAGMRTAMQQARDAGVSLFFSGSNEVYWRIRFEASPTTGASNRTEVCYKSVQSGGPDPSGIPTTTWRDPSGPNNPENALAGEMYIGDNDTTYFPFQVSAVQGADRIYRYTGLDTQQPGAVARIGTSLTGWEWDGRVSNGAEPPGVITLASSPVTGELLTGNGAGYIQNQSASPTMVKYKAPSGALVVTTGTNHWNRGLDVNAFGVGEPNLIIQQTTTNILADMGAMPSTPQPNIVLDPIPGVGPPAPTGVTAAQAGSDSATISWSPVTGASGYTVYRSLAARQGGLPLGTRVSLAQITGTSFTDYGLTGSTSYYYVVTATAGGVQSVASTESIVSLPALTTPPVRINSGGPAYTTVGGAAFAADSSFSGGSTYSTTQGISGTTDPALYQNERWGQFTYTISVPNGTYDVRMHFAELYYGTDVPGSCVGKRIFSVDITNTPTSPDIANQDVCAQAGGPRIALMKTVSNVPVTNGTITIKSVYGAIDDPEMTAIEVVPSIAGPPTVTQTTPGTGATNVAVTTAPTASFSRTMDPATLTSATFTLKDSLGNAVAGSVTYDAGTTAATLTPSAALAASTTYTATVTTGAKASDGKALTAAYSWSFTTGAPVDTTPPTAPTNLQASSGGLSTINLTWGASTDNVGVDHYDVFRSATSGFTPAPTNRIAQPKTTTYSDVGLASGTYYYRVQAVDAAGNASLSSNQASAAATGDTTPPTVALTAPAAGTVSGTVTVSANASDNVGVAGVQFKLDGVNLGGEVLAAPYSVSWDTTATANGPHTLTAFARDAAGNNTTSTPVNVTVSNTAPPPATFLFGDQTVEPIGDYNNAGLAEAFQLTAGTAGTVTQLSVYVDAGSSATQLVAGLYANNNGHPGTLLAQGTLNSPVAGTWNNVPIASTAVTSGAVYWIAFVGPVGTLKFRDRCCGGGTTAETSAQQTLTSLPATWASGSTYKDGPASVYAAGPSVTGPPPSQVGQWSSPVSWPIVAVHMSLLPTGNVITWDGFDAALNSERIWNPTTATFTPIPYGRNLFCGGHILLPDGRTLVVGGHIAADNGLADTTLFNAMTNTYTRAPDMAVGRWYPTATELGNGKVFVFSGDNIVPNRPGQTPPFTSPSVNSLPEVFDPATNTWLDLTSSRLTSPLYPQVFQLSDGRLIDVGPDTTTRTITPGTWTWQTFGTSPFDGMSSVMYRPDKIMKAGTWADPDFNGTLAYAAHGRTAVLDMTQPSPAWRETAAMNFPRAYQNLTLLPDGTVLASGGTTSSDGIDLTKAVLAAEIWDPTTEKWTTVASLANGRGYHSTAILLPDGRVLMAGGGQLPGSGAINQTNAEIYSPPYLFKGARPTITSTPGTIQYGSSFTVQTPDAASIKSVTLIRTPSVTHAFDQNQRFVPLSFTAGAGQLSVTTPSNPNTAPPGYYLLFIVNTNGVPSVASFVRFPAPWEDTQPPTAPTALTATGGAGSVALSWTAATDNIGVTRYDIYRSTTSGFAPGSGNLVGASATTSYTDVPSSGTFYYLVRAEDAAGNVGPQSNQASATVTSSDTIPPTVALTAPAAGATVSGTISVTATASDDVSVAGVQFKLDGANLGPEDTVAPYAFSWDTTTASNGVHTLTAVARDPAGNTATSTPMSVTVNNSAPPPTKVLLGDQTIEASIDFNSAGLAEAFQTSDIAAGTLSKVSVYVDSGSAATALAVGIYSNNNGHPGTLLSQGTLSNPVKGAWNDVTMPGTAIAAGTTYWVALLSPNGTGQLKVRDRCCGGGTVAETSQQASLATLPATWTTGSVYNDGPFSAYASGF